MAQRSVNDYCAPVLVHCMCQHACNAVGVMFDEFNLKAGFTTCMQSDANIDTLIEPRVYSCTKNMVQYNAGDINIIVNPTFS